MKPAVPLLAIIASMAGVAPAPAADFDNGLRLAQGVCADCHSVRAHEPRSPDPQAPTFQALASTPGMTSTALTVALTTAHAGMPMLRLTADERADLIAYILSLR
jgi:mono/diheme cytochrome c family protein